MTNAGGAGAQTVDGIKLIDVAGASDASFTLAGDSVVDGRPVVVAGAFAYSLWKNGVADPADGDWYLRSQSLEPSPRAPPQPARRRSSPGVPIYEAYPRTLLALNGLPTMQERIGNRYWTAPATRRRQAGAGAHGAALGRPRRGPARLGAGRGRAGQPAARRRVRRRRPTTTWTSGSCRSASTGRCTRPTTASLIGGVTFNYGTVDTDVSSDFGDGSIDTEGYGFGGSLTWLRDDGLYVDGQAQLIWYDSDLSSDASARTSPPATTASATPLGVEAGKRIAAEAELDGHAAGAARSTPRSTSTASPIPSARVSSADEGASMPVRLGVSLDQESGWRATRAATRGGRTSTGSPTSTTTCSTDTEVTVGGTGLTSRQRPVLGLARRRRHLQLERRRLRGLWRGPGQHQPRELRRLLRQHGDRRVPHRLVEVQRLTGIVPCTTHAQCMHHAYAE